MNLLIKPTSESAKKADSFIKILDQTKGAITSSPAFLSKVTKNLKTTKAPVMRYFDTPGSISNYFSEGEYDLVAVFKLLKYESYFLKASQKQLSLLTKSGYSVVSDNDEVTEYFDKRFLVMQLSTGISLDTIIRTLAWYLIVCSNAFLIKVRDKDFQYATSYTKDGKEMHPVVGYFLVHPTTMKPKFKYIKDSYKGQTLYKWEIEKWIQTNRKGQIREFSPDDVIHFTLYKEDGMILGMPNIIPVVDDIRTLRKIEEDIQLLIYRDLFPIIHYKVEKPQMVDHISQNSELDMARRDMQSIIQDGGIATDARHSIEFVGSNGKALDIAPYLDHFKQRVWTGLGVSALDMSVAEAGNLGSAQEASKTLLDTVKFIQQEMSKQFEENILMELALQSPFDDILYDKSNLPKLVFQEIDIEWKIRQENHEADLFAKGVKTIHETRNKFGDKNLTDDDLMYTHPGLYGATPPNVTLLDTPYGDKYANHEGKIAHATAVETVTKTSQPGAPSKKTHTKPIVKTGKSAATSDPIKTSKSNSNIVKKKAHDFMLNDAQKDISLKDTFVSTITKLKGENKVDKKINIIFATKCVYDEIKSNMKQAISKGIEDACYDLGVEPEVFNIEHNIFKPLDALRDNVTEKVYENPEYLNKAANRIAITNRTEQNRAYNYGYALACVNNKKTRFKIVSDHEDIADDSMEMIGQEITLSKDNIIDNVPPFRPNSRLKIKVCDTDIKDSVKEEDLETKLTRDRFLVDSCGIKFDTSYITKTYGIEESDIVKEVKKPALEDDTKDQVVEVKSHIDSLKDELATVIDRNKITVEDIDIKIQDAISNAITKLSENKPDDNSKTLEMVLQSIVGALRDSSDANLQAIKSVADSIPKEINITTPPIEVKITNPEVEVKVPEQKPTTKKLKNVIRNEAGQIVSAEFEETE